MPRSAEDSAVGEHLDKEHLEERLEVGILEHHHPVGGSLGLLVAGNRGRLEGGIDQVGFVPIRKEKSVNCGKRRNNQ